MRSGGPPAAELKEKCVMKKRSKTASIVLFLAALVVGFDAQSSWCAFGTLAPGYAQCDVATGFPPIGTGTFMDEVFGMVVLQDGTVLVANRTTGLYSFKPGSTCLPLPLTVTPLSPSQYLGMAIGLDGKVYANGVNGNVYTVNPTTGAATLVVGLTGVYGLGMALDPLTGDLYITSCGPSLCGGPNIRRITGLYGPHPSPSIDSFVIVTGAKFDGLAWSCDGTRLVAASLGTNQIYQFDRVHTIIPGFPIFSGGGPDGVVFGAEGTPFEGYFFVSFRAGWVRKIANDGTTTETIAHGGQDGDFVAVDRKGNLLLTQNPVVPSQKILIARLSTTSPPDTPGTSGCQWVLPGSTLCGDLGCHAKALTTQQINRDPCLSGLNANLLVTLAQSACVDCASCATLNQARLTLLDFLNSLGPPPSCFDLLKGIAQSLYSSCPCNCPCAPPCNQTSMVGGPCLAKTEFPFGIDLESYDPILQTFIREVMSP
jgi:DNA-binding beta-propeller fold protein YncE